MKRPWGKRLKIKQRFSRDIRINAIGFAKLIAYAVFRMYLVISRKQIRVVPIEKSIQIILKERLSVARFGDGEFKWMFKDREPDNFEKNSSELASALLKVVKTSRPGFQVCIPDAFDGLTQYRRLDAFFWAGQLGHHGYRWVRTLSSKRTYLDSLVTRPYMIYKDRSQGDRLFKLIKQIWDKRHVILVEGSETRFGVGNDLLNNAAKVERIICPAKNAFEHYTQISKTITDLIKNIDDSDILVLVSLGPTATVLANDVNFETSVQVLDIGHLDLEYSWMLMHADEKVPLNYKYVNEIENGDKVQSVPSKFLQRYNSEILIEIK
ncbi:GT-D fold domain-containing glycosyltransferase [Lacticaseibacillus paracasei]|jgi:glycosyltransferase family protein|uniref:GT-D fold domain-containing glycosyltransferase n=1 Tax=Lacticaseibacillus paracasei TaxID=1597 RepID=UPI0022E8626C|nr:GT-D fold domain-containing glycosyltransferase [Lacticaseibacillus paracasei]